jgi:glycerol-3-phosphate dehydrogenase (NAD(P)+)
VKVGIIGSGGWGTALANLLAGSGADVCMWDVDTQLLEMLATDRENKKYLPGVRLGENIRIAQSCEACVAATDFVVTAVPTQHFRAAFSGALPHIRDDAIIVNVAKGIELGSLKTPSMIFAELAPGRKFVVISGPSHAEEVAQCMPTTVCAASEDIKAAEEAQDLFMNKDFRVYTQSDVIGVELGGALKNVIALGAGITDGMGCGDNTKAALMTRGITEMARLGESMGANRETFFGLSGIGDLIVTCTSMHSRNRRCGIMIGEGVPAKEAMERIGMVVEGVSTAEATRELAEKLRIEMPITEAICRIVSGEVSPESALSGLMTRSKKHESEVLLEYGRDR